MTIMGFVDGPYRAFDVHNPGDLDGKEGYALELKADGKVQLYSGAGASPAIAVHFGQLKAGAPVITGRMIGKGGTTKFVAGEAIALGARVKAAAGGKVVNAVATDRSIGINIEGNAVAGQLFEALDVVEKV